MPKSPKYSLCLVHPNSTIIIILSKTKNPPRKPQVRILPTKKIDTPNRNDIGFINHSRCSSISLDISTSCTHNKEKTYYVNKMASNRRRFTMSNITLSVKDEIIKKVRKIAKEKNEAIKKLQESFKTISRDMGQRQWTREALHER